jgi:hypothetical protein
MEAYYALSVSGFPGKGKGKDESIPVHNYAQSYEGIGGVDILLHRFLTFALDGNEWLVPCSGCFTARKVTHAKILNSRLSVPQCRSGWSADDSNILFLFDIKLQFPQFISPSLITIPTEAILASFSF